MFRATPCSSSGESTVSVQPLVYVTLYRWPFRVQVGTFCHRSPIQSDIYQMLYWYSWFSWWWARGCSKHLEIWNKYMEKNCTSSWSFTKTHNEMHRQQDIKNELKEWETANMSVWISRRRWRRPVTGSVWPRRFQEV